MTHVEQVVVLYRRRRWNRRNSRHSHESRFLDCRGPYGTGIGAVTRRVGARFPRSETRERAWAYLIGLLGPVQRKNPWQLAEQIGDGDPYGVQYLLGRSDWDPDAVRDDLRAYVVETLDDSDAVLILDETGSLKEGEHSAHVQRGTWRSSVPGPPHRIPVESKVAPAPIR